MSSLRLQPGARGMIPSTLPTRCWPRMNWQRR